MSCQYKKTARLITRAMSFFYLGFIILNLDPIDFENETRCTIRLVRAGAYMGMRRGERALCEIENAHKLIPDSMTLATVSQTWQVMFDSPPNFSSILCPFAMFRCR